MTNIFDDILKKLKTPTEVQNTNSNTGSVYSAPNEPKKIVTPKVVNNGPYGSEGIIKDNVVTENKAQTVGDLYQKGKEINQNINNTFTGISNIIGGFNKARLENGTASPIVRLFDTANKGVNAAKEAIGKGADIAHNLILDQDFNNDIDTKEIENKLKLDPTYASKIIGQDGQFIDNTQTIANLKESIKNSTNSVDKKSMSDQLKELEQIESDQRKLLYKFYYDELVNSGATDEEIEAYKNYVITQDDGAIQKLLGTVHSSVESFAGSFAKSAEALYQKVATIMGTDFDSNDPNSLGSVLIDNAEQIRANASQGVEGAAKVIQDIYNGSSNYLIALGLALITKGQSISSSFSSFESAKQVNDLALLYSDISVFGSNIKEKMDQGYTFDNAIYNSAQHAIINHLTEKIGGESLMKIITTPLGNLSTKYLSAYLGKSIAMDFGSEFVEEMAETFINPIVDDYTLNTGLTLDQYISETMSKDSIYEWVIGGLGGLVMGTAGGAYNVIRTKQDFNLAINQKAQLNEFLNNGGLTQEEKLRVSKRINELTTMINEYRELNPYVDAITKQSDIEAQKPLTIDEIEEATIIGGQEQIMEDLDEASYFKQQMFEKGQQYNEAIQNKLQEDGVNIETAEWNDLTLDQKYDAEISAKYANFLNRPVKFAELTDAEGKVVDGAFVNGQYVINPKAKLGAFSTLIHEYTHGIERSKYYGNLRDNVKKFYGESYDSAIQKIKADYSTFNENMSDDDAERELVAITTQALLADEDYVNRLVKYDNSLASKLYEDIKHLATFTNTVSNIEYNFMRAFNEFEADNTTGPATIEHSYVKNEDIMKAQQMYLKEKATGNGKIDPEVLNTAHQDMKVMANLMSENSQLLPAETIGKVLLKDASYGYSVENSTKCPRTLAYDELTNLVSEKIDRPLTAIESFLVSQKLYQIAVDPQCLYCYVALDRKSYNEFVGRYIDQRNQVIQAYKDAGSPTIRNFKNAETAAENSKLFREFLDGRKPTINMWNRFKSWIDDYNNGVKLLSKSDVASDQRRADIQNEGGKAWEQLKDILAYAQSASWSKKAYEYRAYFDDIRRLSDRQVNQLNKHYGLRWYSFNDYTPAYILENMQQFADASLKGLKGLAYTKDTDFARIFAPTGVNINISMYAKEMPDGTFAIDPVQSANLQEAIELRNQYSNVGIVVTGTSDAAIRWALDQEWSDVVIPFHIVRTGSDIAEYYKWSVYNSEQNDTVIDKNKWNEYVKGLNLPENKISKMVYPSEHQNDYETYMKLCDERGLKPRFNSFRFNPDGSLNTNYMKLVNETRQSDNQTGYLTPVFDMNAALESFERFKNKGGFYGGWYKDGIDLNKEANDVANDILQIEQGLKKYQDIKYGEGYVDFNEYLEMKKKKNKVSKLHGKGTIKASLGIQASDLVNYDTAVNDNDMDTAGKIVAKVAADKGFNVEAWHGTMNYGFNQFKTDIRYNGKNIGSHFGSEDAANGFANNDDYGHGGGNAGVYHVYLKVNNPYETFDMFAQENSYIACETWKLADQLEQEGNNDQFELARRVKEYLNRTYNIPMELEGDEQIDDLWDETFEYGNEHLSNQKIAGTDGFYDLNQFDDDTLYEYLVDVAKANGYDSFKYENNLEDNGQDDYVVFDSEQIKSADPVTYDDDGNIIPLEERFDLDQKDIRYSKGISLADIENYKVAAETNDEDAAQAIINRVASENGYDTSDIVYHGSDYNDINTFDSKYHMVMEDNGISKIKGFFSNLKGYSSEYGEYVNPYYLKDGKYLYLTGVSSLEEMVQQLKENGVTNVKFNEFVTNPEEWQGWFDEIGYTMGEDVLDPWFFFNYNGGNLTERIAAAGYRGVTWLEGADDSMREGYSYMPFYSEDIKSAKPFEYDDQGNLIPLDQRFNDSISDIRYSRGLAFKEIIRKISKNALDENGKLKPFETQLNEYDKTPYDRRNRLIVSDNTSDLEWSGINDRILTISEKAINKILYYKHSNDNLYNVLKNIKSLLKNNTVISYDGVGNNTGRKQYIIDIADSDNPILVGIGTKNINYGEVEINDITTIHKRNNIIPTISKGNSFYLNKKSIEWLHSLGQQLPSNATIYASNDIINKYKEDFNGSKNEFIARNDIEYSKGMSIDSLGIKLTDSQNEYFKYSKARDDQGRLLKLYHGSPNATFTIFNDSNDPRYDQGKNPNNAIYLTTDLSVAQGFSDTDKIIDPNEIYSTKTVEEFNKVVKDNGYDFKLMQIEETYSNGKKENYYYLVGNGDDIASSMDQGDMEQYYEIRDALEDYDENSFETEIYKLNVGSTIEEALSNIKQLMPVDKGNYEVYANATNPLIVDCEGSLWSEIKTPSEIDTDKKTMTTREIEDWVVNNGNYDSIIFKNVNDPAAYTLKRDQISDVVVVFNSNQIKSTNNLNPSSKSDIRYSKGLSMNELLQDNKWVKDTQEVLDEVNRTSVNELTVENIDDILHQRKVSPRTIETIENTKKVMIDEADKWIKGYETIKAEYPMFSKETLNNALYETLIYGEIGENTYNAMANILSSEFSLEGISGDIKKEIDEFVKESFETFSNEAKYKAGQINTDAVKKAINENIAYGQGNIQDSYDKVIKGAKADQLAADNKKTMQEYYQPLVDDLIKEDYKKRETKGKKVDDKVSDWKTIDQNIFELANGNSDLYNLLKRKIRYECLDTAAARKALILKEAQENVIDKCKELGIFEGSNESKGLQYYIEKHTEEKVRKPKAENGEYASPWREYTLDNLKADYDYSMPNGRKAWENIVDAEKIISNSYEDLIYAINRTQIEANGDIEGKAEAETTELLIEVEKAFTALETIKDEIRRNGSTEATQAAFEIERQKYNKLVKQYNERISKDEKGDLTRRNLTPIRKNYSHHVVKNNLKTTINSILNAEFRTPTELAGTSDFTNPNTIFSTFSVAQEFGNYIPDALASYAAYALEASNVIAYNPAILELRQFNKDIKATAQGTQLNRLSEYLNDYCNMLAGKRNGLDRNIQKSVGAGFMNFIQASNKYAKAAALVGNIRSGLVQFANIPNGLGILEAKGGKSFVTDIANGMKSWINNFRSEGQTVIDQSPFMSDRYFEFDTGKFGLKNSLKDKVDGVLKVGDKVGAEIIWWSAYNQALRTNPNVDAILYADDVTRNAIAGRSKADMAIALNSQVWNLVLPFQVENNNLYQTLKQQVKNKDIGAVTTYVVAAYLFNSIIKGITGGDDEVLSEFLTPIVDEVVKALKDEEEVNDVVKNAFWGEIGEMVSLTPAGEQLLSLAMDSDTLDELFGDYNPSRYGMTNIGIAGIGKIFKALEKDNSRVALADAITQFVGSYVSGGKQITRTVGGLQSMGGLPKLNPEGNIEVSPVNYTNSGRISYVNDQSNIMDWVKAGLFGKSNTSEAQKYYDGFNSLSEKDERIFNSLEGSAYDNYKSVQEYKQNKADAKANKDNVDYDETTLREQLMAEGKYGSYKDSVVNAYSEYMKEWYSTDHESDEEPKSWTQFANSYGISSYDLKQDTYNDFYDTYNVSEEAQKVFSEAMDIENVKNSLNKTIANSGATLRRVAYEQAGIYDQILEYIDNNGLEYSDFGLTKTVVGYDQKDIDKMIAKINGEKYTDDTSSSGSRTSAASKQKKAMKAYMNAINSANKNVFSILNQMTTIKDAKSKVKEIMKNSYKG